MRERLTVLMAALLALPAIGACTDDSGPQTGSETHWLMCRNDGDCTTGFSCVSGTCEPNVQRQDMGGATDGGATDDGAGEENAADSGTDATISCESLPQRYRAVLQQHRSCQSVDDCTVVGGVDTWCEGAPVLGNGSGDAIAKSGQAAAAALLQRFYSDACASWLARQPEEFDAAPATNLRCEAGRCTVDAPSCFLPPDMGTGTDMGGDMGNANPTEQPAVHDVTITVRNDSTEDRYIVERGGFCDPWGVTWGDAPPEPIYHTLRFEECVCETCPAGPDMNADIYRKLGPGEEYSWKWDGRRLMTWTEERQCDPGSGLDGTDGIRGAFQPVAQSSVYTVSVPYFEALPQACTQQPGDTFACPLSYNPNGLTTHLETCIAGQEATAPLAMPASGAAAVTVSLP